MTRAGARAPPTRPSAGEPIAPTPALDEDRRIDHWLAVIAGPLAEAPGSPERKLAVVRAAEDHDCSARSVYRALKAYEQWGELGLARRCRSDAGVRRVIFSRVTDDVIGDPDLLVQLRDEADGIAIGWWKCRSAIWGARRIARKTSELLHSRMVQRGQDYPKEAIVYPRLRAEQFRQYGMVELRRHDAKAYADQQPRARRRRNHMKPMDLVCLDVMQTKNIVLRSDGSESRPRLIAFEDAGTGRVFGYPVQLKEHEGIRREHVCEAFLAMATDPAWGLPKAVQCDNGGENNLLKKLRGPLAHLARQGRFVEAVTKARPYNPQSKPIEGWFARFNRFGLSLFEGYVGRDRTAKKTQNRGKKPKPYGDSFEKFKAEVVALIAAFNREPVGGAREGRSPEEIFARHVADSWTRIAMPRAELEAAFYQHKIRRIDRGCIKVNGRFFTHPLILASAKAKVRVAEPWRRDDLPLFRFETSEPWTYAEPAPIFDYDDLAGTAWGDLWRSAQGRTLSEMATHGETFEPISTLLSLPKPASALPPPENTVVLDGGSQVADLADALIGAPVQKQVPDNDERRRAANLAEIERIRRRRGRERGVCINDIAH